MPQEKDKSPRRKDRNIKLSKVIVCTDFDDTVFNTSKRVNAEVAKLDEKVIFAKPELKVFLETQSCMAVAMDNENFPNILTRMKPYYPAIFKSLELEEGAGEVLNALQKQGASLYGVTARSRAIISDDIEEITRNRLEELGLHFDKILIEADDKSVIREYVGKKHCVFIDDSLKHCIEVRDALPDALIIHYDRRTNIEAPEGVVKASSWTEIDSIIREHAL